MGKVTVEDLKDLHQRCIETLATLKTLGLAPDQSKKLNRTFSISKSQGMIGRTRASVYSALDELGLSQEQGVGGRNTGLSLKTINQLREHFGTLPWRDSSEEAKIIAIQSFKGGVTKSSTSVHFAQFLALKGYRVLLMDCDPQASATSSFGYVPDNDFSEKDTIIPFLNGEQKTLHYAIKKTYFEGIDLVPSCLEMNTAEFGLFDAVANSPAGEGNTFFFEFREALDSVKDGYDIVIMDSPPALGPISINILAAADSLIIPMPPALYELSSTTQYIEMAKTVIERIAPNKTYDFVKVLAAKVERGKEKQIDFLELIKDRFGKFKFENPILSTSAIPNAASFYQTIYDAKIPNQKVVDMLDRGFSEIESEVKKLWPSKQV